MDVKKYAAGVQLGPSNDDGATSGAHERRANVLKWD